MGVLSDKQINALVTSEHLSNNGSTINPASINLTLGPQISVPMWYWRNKITARLFWKLETHGLVLSKYRDEQYLKKHNTVRYLRWGKPYLFKEYDLYPGEFVLCHSMEYTRIPDDLVALLFERSSVGREGLEHLHAGYGDPGFSGQWTWELINVSPWPIRLVAGKELMQLVFLKMDEIPVFSYRDTGRYNGQTGPTPSMGI